MFDITATGQALGVTSIDFHKSKNGSDHHTWEYEINDLVVRRGKVFSITISFDRDVDVEKDLVVVQLTFGMYSRLFYFYLRYLSLHGTAWPRVER